MLNRKGQSDRCTLEKGPTQSARGGSLRIVVSGIAQLMTASIDGFSARKMPGYPDCETMVRFAD
ncbi:hypothetical protein V1290_000969 [Bradyrhizobium sp. AZCC 1578]|jgi:hypothetical protein|uniref:hypothetical protein n=1 Tax=Bradyrhizobium sp. AZCC 1578 TaxID=3117027 RepID=UPI002FF29747